MLLSRLFTLQPLYVRTTPPVSWLHQDAKAKSQGTHALKGLNAILQEIPPCKWTWLPGVEGVAFRANQSLNPSSSCMGVILESPNHQTGRFEEICEHGNDVTQAA